MTFLQDKAFGKIGEKIAINIIEDVYNMQVVDVSENREYQKLDIDLIANDEISIEVKTDRMKTPNMFYEIESNSKLGTEGCMLYTEADILFYVLIEHNIVLTIPIGGLREWVLDNWSMFREVPVRTSNARGLLLPINRVISEVDDVGVLNLKGVSVKHEEQSYTY